MKILNGTYKNVAFEYSSHNAEDESNGILTVKLDNGVESTHIIKNWGITRIFQYIASMENYV